MEVLGFTCAGREYLILIREQILTVYRGSASVSTMQLYTFQLFNGSQGFTDRRVRHYVSFFPVRLDRLLMSVQWYHCMSFVPPV